MGRLLLVLAVLALSATTVGAQSSDWPAWRGPNGDGTTSYTDWNPLALTDGAKIAWTVDITLGYSNIAVRGGKVYAVGRTKGYPSMLCVWCLDAAKGTVIWKSTQDAPGLPYASPALDGDQLYTLTSAGGLVCLRLSDGSLVWQAAMDDYGALRPSFLWSASPVIEGDVLLLSANSKALGIRKATGALLWAIDDPRQEFDGFSDNDSVSSAAVATVKGRRVAYFALASTAWAVDPATGAVFWTYRFPGLGTYGDPVVLGDSLLVTRWGFWGTVLKQGAGTSAEVVWTSPVSFGGFPGPVALGGHLYGTIWTPEFYPHQWVHFSEDPFPFVCQDTVTGAITWTREVPWQNLIAVGERIIGLEPTGILHVYDASPAGLKELATADIYGGKRVPRVFASAPVFAGGYLYCRNYNGDLICVDMR
jgi:outer membrane protein assembly factor BamB